MFISLTNVKKSLTVVYILNTKYIINMRLEGKFVPKHFEVFTVIKIVKNCSQTCFCTSDVNLSTQTTWRMIIYLTRDAIDELFIIEFSCYFLVTCYFRAHFIDHKELFKRVSST